MTLEDRQLDDVRSADARSRRAARFELVSAVLMTVGFLAALSVGGVALANSMSPARSSLGRTLENWKCRHIAYCESRIRVTEGAVQTVRSAAIQFRAENPGDGCPSMDDLAEQQYLDSGRRLEDAWENDFRIACVGRDIVVTSAGPDELFGTEDDIE
ncbi:MAG: hypothetical protein AAF411_27215 [Myxococcota bacterium]